MPLLRGLRGILIASTMGSGSPPLRETFVGSVGRSRYVEPLSLQLVAPAMWDLCLSWSPPLIRGTYGRLRYVKLSRLYSTWDVFRRRST